MDEAKALQLAQEAYRGSTSFLDSNYRKQWETNLQMFQSKHPQGSKYNSDAYKYRSKIFRPKTRSAVRRLEAATAAAYFSNMDVVGVDPTNTKNPKQAEAAKVMKELLQYRLTKTIPWFMTIVGGMQDAATIGVVCSYQDWKYKEKRTKREKIRVDEAGVAVMEDGKPAIDEIEEVEVIEDRPCVELIAVENLRIDPAAKWYDPINTSPYVIELMPMYVQDVREMMDTEDPKTGEPSWIRLDDGQLRGSVNQAYDSTRQVREGQREDSQQSEVSLTDFEIVWVHRNIIRKDGTDWVYYTAGTEHLLSKPKKLKEVYFTGNRPYVMGMAVIETHKIYPASPVEMGANIQREINEVVNSRLDNVKLAMNKRYIARRGAQVDIKSLVRNVAGSVTLATDVDKDVREVEFNDVTASAFQEQDRLNIEHDELSGAFSQSSVMTNRKLNETVGGMGMLTQNANQITEYTIRTVTETWVEPVLRQITDLEAHYETDETVLALVGDRTGIQVTQEHLNQDLNLTVNVGMGATDPTMRLNKLLAAAKNYAEILSLQAPGLNGIELGKEIFGIAGYRDGGRFLQEEGQQDPKMAELMQIAEQLKQELLQEKAGTKVKEDEIAMRAHVESAKIEAGQQAEQARLATEQQGRQAELAYKSQESAAKIESDKVIEIAKISSAHELEQTRLTHERDNEEKRLALERKIAADKITAEREAEREKLALEEKKLAQEKELEEKRLAQERELREKEIALEDKRQREQAEKDRQAKAEAKKDEPKKPEPAKEVHVHMHEGKK